jgi:four helix bundle protein
MKDFRNLLVWEKSHIFSKKVYVIIKSFPKEEKFSLSTQLWRASYSIPVNIAEGCGRGSDKELKRFLQYAMGSACECEYLLLLIIEINLLTKKEYNQLSKKIVEIKKMLAKLINKLKADC